MKILNQENKILKSYMQNGGHFVSTWAEPSKIGPWCHYGDNEF